MDPEACYKRFCNALTEGDVQDAAFAAEDLTNWFRKAGFVPKKLQHMGTSAYLVTHFQYAARILGQVANDVKE